MFKMVTLGVMCLLIQLSLALSTMVTTAAGDTLVSITTLKSTVKPYVLSTDAQGDVLSEILPSQVATVVLYTDSTTTIPSTEPTIYAWTSWTTVHTASSGSKSTIGAATSAPTLASTPTPSMPPNVTIITHTNNTPVYAGAGVGSAAAVIALSVLGYWCYRRRRRPSGDLFPSATLLTPHEREKREEQIRQTQERQKKLREEFANQEPVQKPRSILTSWLHRGEPPRPEISHPFPQQTSQDILNLNPQLGSRNGILPAAALSPPRPPRPASLADSTMRDMQDGSIPSNLRAVSPEYRLCTDNIEMEQPSNYGTPRTPPTPTPRGKNTRNPRKQSPPSSVYSKQTNGEPYRNKKRREYKAKDKGKARDIVTQDNLTEQLDETILGLQSTTTPRWLSIVEVQQINPYHPSLHPFLGYGSSHEKTHYLNEDGSIVAMVSPEEMREMELRTFEAKHKLVDTSGSHTTQDPHGIGSALKNANQRAGDQNSIYEDSSDDILDFPYPSGATLREDLTEANEFERSLNRAQAIDVLEGDAGYSHRRAATEQTYGGARPQLGQGRQTDPLQTGPIGSSMHGLRKIRD